MKKLRVLFGIYLMLALTVSCAPRPRESSRVWEESEYTIGHSSRFVYQDTFFYLESAIIRFCPLENLGNLELYSQALCFDPLCEHIDSRCGAYTGAGMTKMCLREIDGSVSLFVEYGRSAGYGERVYEIVRFDIGNGKKTVLVKDRVNPIHNFLVTDDYILFDEYMGDHTSLRVYSFADKSVTEQVNTERQTFRPIGCSGDRVYYSSGTAVYSNTVRLDSEKLLFTGQISEGFSISGGNLYFLTNPDSQVIDGIRFNFVDVGRTPLGSASINNCDIVASGLCYYGSAAYYIDGGMLYYLPGEPDYIGEAVVEGTNGMEDQYFSIINEHNGTVIGVDLETLEKEIIIEESGYNFMEKFFVTPEFLIFLSGASGYRTDVAFDPYGAVFVYERDTEKLYPILYYGPEME